MQRIVIDWDGEAGGTVYTFRETRSDFELQSVEKLAPEGTFSPSGRIYLNIPLRSLNFRVLEFPFDDIKKIKTVLPFEIGNLLLQDTKDMTLDAVVIDRNTEKTTVLAVCVEKSLLSRALSFASGMGSQPHDLIAAQLRALVRDFRPENLIDLPVLSEEDLVLLFKEEFSHPIVNFQQTAFRSEQGKALIGKQLRLSAVLAGILFLVVAADGAVQYQIARRNAERARASILATYQSIFPEDQVVVDPLYQAKAHFKAIQDKEIDAGVLPNEILLKLAKIPQGPIIVNELVMAGTGIIIKGESPDFRAIEVWKNKAQTVFAEAGVLDSKSFNNRISFTIRLREKA